MRTGLLILGDGEEGLWASAGKTSRHFSVLRFPTLMHRDPAIV